MNGEGDEKVAIIQGEFHLSTKDANRLVNRELEEWDAILVEGREPVYSLENARFGFWYYAIGAIFTRTMVRAIHRIKGELGLAEIDPLESAEIDTDARIDATHREIWNFTNRWFRWSLLLLAAGASIWTLMNPDFLNNWNNLFFATYHSTLFFYPFLPMFLHIITIVNPTNSRLRNEVMCDSIVNHASEQGHDRLLILVGEMHREGITNQLESRGWKINSQPTQSRAGKVISHIYRKFGNWG